MHLSDFDFELPEELIAQTPTELRSASRLLVADRDGNGRQDAHFSDLPSFLSPGDLLVVNESAVVPARLFLFRPTGGRVEMLVLREAENGCVVAWLKPAARIRQGERLEVAGSDAGFVLRDRVDDREFLLAFDPSAEHATLDALFADCGHIPLPPYIRRSDNALDRSRYQTVYAREKGSAAAPTAGLHFDKELLDALASDGIEIAPVTLHVGPGTFSPLDNDVVTDNTLHTEEIAIPASTFAAIARTRSSGKRVVAVGTTATRTLEAAAREGWFDGPPADRRGETRLFIYPGFDFAVVDALVTNFHLPMSSLLVLVSAFMGRENALDCYRHAVTNAYRFFSYGDAMLIR